MARRRRTWSDRVRATADFAPVALFALIFALLFLTMLALPFVGSIRMAI